MGQEKGSGGGAIRLILDLGSSVALQATCLLFGGLSWLRRFNDSVAALGSC
jgi:hypothetical protein